jgi:hypothetical protein
MAKPKTPAKTTDKPAKAKADQKSPAAKAESTMSASAPVITAETAPPPAAVLANPVILDATDETDEVVLTDAEGRRYCRSTDCDQIGVVDGYCRYHYLYFWRKIQNRKKILADGKLERYIDELTARYTDKFIELLRKDLRTEKDFMAALQELDLDDSSQASDEDDKTYLEEIRGMTDDATAARDDDTY